MNFNAISVLICWIAFCCGGLVFPTSAAAIQVGSDELQPQVIRSEAWIGEPCGVGMISFRLPENGNQTVQPTTLLRTGAVSLSDPQRRVVYAVMANPPVARFFRGIVGPAKEPTDQIVTYWFLFRGDEPLQVDLLGCSSTQIVLTPAQPRGRQHERLFQQWWREYLRNTKQQIAAGDYPDLVETYLTSMLSRRLGVALEKRSAPVDDPLQKTFDLLMDTEQLRSRIIHDWFQGHWVNQSPNLPPPPALSWSPVVTTGVPEDLPIEPMAQVVPVECFYFRFGTWDNQLWLKKLLEENGGDLSRLVQLRGYQARVESKFLDQLALESTQLDEWFGGNLIQDVGIIGTDTYFQSGSSIGVLLHAKDTGMLTRQITGRRQRFAERAGAGVEVVSVDIGDQKVGFLSSRDNRYRSFHVVNGDFHLITNSRHLAEKFLRPSSEALKLGDSPEFRYARYLMPVDRNDTVFVYLSTAFFQQLLSPQYQIELFRRSRSVAEMQMLQLAKMAAAGEGYDDAPLEFLIGNGFLPAGFEETAVDGRIEIRPEGWLDSARGLRGFFLPIPDTPLGMVTAAETAWFQERAGFFAENLGRLDPVLVGIQRFELSDQVERVVFDARVAPFAQNQYGWLTDRLGEPLQQVVRGSADDIIRLQASLQGGTLTRRSPPYQMFAAVQDEISPDLDLQPSSIFDAWRTFKQIPGYLGAWPQPGVLDWLPRLGSQPDEYGYTYSRLLDLWRLQYQDFSVLSFDQQRLERLKSDLRVEANPRASQLRLEVSDLSQSRLQGWANSLNYRRSWQTSVANVRLLNTLIHQFGVEPAGAKEIAESLLDVRLVCALDGEYQLLDRPGCGVWASTAWPDFKDPQLPEEYVAPLLKWFRGLELEVTNLDTQFAVHGYLDMQRGQTEKSVLPGFDLFKGFQNLLPGK